MMTTLTSRAALAAVLIAGFASAAHAQDKKAAPAAKPAAAAAAPADAAKQSAWVKLCEKATQVAKDKDGKEAKTEKNICLTHHERLDGNSGMVIVSAALREVEGSDKKQFMVMVPLGMALPPGLKAAVYTKDMWEKAAKNEKIDEAKLKPVDLKFSLCHAGGCTAEIEATLDLINSMKTGGGLMVLALNAAAQPIGFPVPLDGFDKAFVGPPVDNQKYFEARQDLMKRIRELQVERYEKFKAEQLKNLPPPPTGQAAPATAAAPAPGKK
ncbi:MAG: invasion protein [Verrucomicrobiae bacterium]|nr:invasion protein [Verrucomicrobiae bacterium]